MSALSSDRSAKAGIMVRNKMTGGRYPGGCRAVRQRQRTGVDGYATDGGTAYTTTIGGGFMAPAVSLPAQLKLVRSGTTYTGSYSIDGTTWTTVGTGHPGRGRSRDTPPAVAALGRNACCST